MADIIVTESGSKLVTVTVTDSRYVINKSPYGVTLDNQHTPIVPPSTLWTDVQTKAEDAESLPITVAGKTLYYLGSLSGSVTEFPITISGTQSRTMAIWFLSVDGLGSPTAIARVHPDSWDSFSTLLEVIGPGATGSYVVTGSGIGWNTPETPTPAGWHLLVVVESADGVAYYLDGVQVQDPATYGPSVSDTGTFSCGRPSLSGVGEILAAGAYWNRSLTEEECSRLWNEADFPT